jgi:hypothetical protein|tara:strand:- start:919 stop:1197 length:279 start_codon:yes stop_codon:yes gene_type:complete
MADFARLAIIQYTALSFKQFNNQPHRLAICGPLAVEVPDNLSKKGIYYETDHSRSIWLCAITSKPARIHPDFYSISACCDSGLAGHCYTFSY